MINITDERRKILGGTYPSRVIAGRQNKHIEGTREFEQANNKRVQDGRGGKQSALCPDINVQNLVDRYKGTGRIRISNGSQYPREAIDFEYIVGKTWVAKLSKYVDTKRIEIIYSSAGTHIIPVSDYSKEVI